ncbi:MAG: S8 family peptidase [Desulfurococcaceae archaeon]
MDRLLRLLVALLIVALVVPVLASVDVHTDAQLIRVIIGVNGDYERARTQISRYGLVELEIPEINAIVLTVPHSSITRLSRLPFIRYIEVDKPVHLVSEVRWNLELINVTDAWMLNETYGDTAFGYHGDVQVAVLDTGIDYTHEDLRNAVVYCIVSLRNGRTFYKGTNLRNCNDQNGHGTHVAGIIAARLNGIGVVGVSPKVTLYAVRVLDASGSGYVSDIAKGIVEATNGPDGVAGTPDDADVISMSLGGSHSNVLYDAVKYAYSYGVVLVAAAGNEGAANPTYPAAYPEVIAVGAIDSNYQVPSWSNRNPDVVAPGVEILSTWPKNRYAYASGTSMACPHVSGAVAIAQAIRLAMGKSRLHPDQVKDLITRTAIDLGSTGYDELYGYGVIDVYSFVITAISEP